MADEIELITVEQLRVAKEAFATARTNSEVQMGLAQFAKVADAVAEASKAVGGIEHLARCIRALVELSGGEEVRGRH